jgi:hypothetical protein
MLHADRPDSVLAAQNGDGECSAGVCECTNITLPHSRPSVRARTAAGMADTVHTPSRPFSSMRWASLSRRSSSKIRAIVCPFVELTSARSGARARATPPWVTGWPGSDRYGTVRYGKCWAMGACVRACVRECGMCVHRPGWEWHRDWRLVPPGGRGQWAPTSCMQQPTHPRAHLFCASQISHTGRPKCTAHASAELGFPRAWSRFVSLIGPNRPRLTLGWRAETPGWGQHDRWRRTSM